MNHSIKSYQFLVFLLSLCYVFASCGLGKQPPKSKSIAISPDKKTIVSVISVLHVTQIRKSGGSTSRRGYTKNYINFYDASTGKQKNKNPIEIDIFGNIVLLTNQCVYLSYYDQKHKRLLLNIYDIENGKLLYDSEKLSQLNNNILLDATSAFHHVDYLNPLLFKGDDAKIYKIDESTGKFERIADNLTARWGNSFNELNELWYYRNDAYSVELKGNNRQQIVYEAINSSKTNISKEKQIVISNVDFIDAKIMGKKVLSTKKVNMEIDKVPVMKDSTIFIMSKSKDSQQFEWIITAIKLPSLEITWSQTLKNPLHLKEHEEIKEIAFEKNNMILLTTQSINCINTLDGSFVYNTRYINETEN